MTIIILSVILISANSYGTDIIAYFSCGDVSGNILRDHSGNKNNAYINGLPNIVVGKKGKTIEFNGINTYAVLTHKDDFEFGKNDSFSISLWIKYEPKNIGQILIEKPGDISPFRIEILPDNKICWTIKDGTNSPKVSINNVSKSWHHLCFVRDVKDDELYAYLDGKLANKAEDTTESEINNKSDIFIGAGNSGNAEFYNGYMDEIAIYERALTKDEVKKCAKGSLPDVYLESALRRFEIIATISVPFTALHSYLIVRGVEMIRQSKVAPKFTETNWAIMGGTTALLSSLVGLWDWSKTHNEDISEMSNPDERNRYSERYSMLNNSSNNQTYTAKDFELTFLSAKF
ncbi:MAG: LamG domain-containing protein [Candidatus Poribacteria bacterium]